jgi:hypothetical protein
LVEVDGDLSSKGHFGHLGAYGRELNIDRLVRAEALCPETLESCPPPRSVSLSEKMRFVPLFAFFALWLGMSALWAFRTDWAVRNGWGEFFFRTTSAERIRGMSYLFLGVGLLFLLFTLGQLVNGTFRWRGETEQYGIADFIR